VAAVRAGASIIALCVAGACAVGAGSAAAKPPKAVPAWYMTATNVDDLRRQARHNACAFAKHQSGGSRVMLLDFGAAREYSDGSFGADLRKVHRFRNTAILKALQNAATSYKKCHVRGSATIAYGNTNTMSRDMGIADARAAGLHQAATVRRLARYMHGTLNYERESAASAGDIEPGWNFPAVSKALVHGANANTRYYDFGNAGGCPGQPGAQGCHNGWDIADLGQVSMGKRSLPLPEIYQPYEAEQWARIQRHWRGNYYFAGVTTAPGVALAPAQSWKALKARAKHVHREIVSIGSSSSSGGSKRGRPGSAPDGAPPHRAPLGGPMEAIIPARLRDDPEPFFSTGLIYPLSNQWVTADHRRFTAVEAGADPTDPSTGVLGILRQNYIHITQREELVRVPHAGALRLTGTPLGAKAAATAQRSGELGFAGENGITGTLHLEAETVTINRHGGRSRR
jgi:hypothetical protein